MREIQDFLHQNYSILDKLSSVFGVENRSEIKHNFPQMLNDYEDLIEFFRQKDDPGLAEFQSSDLDSNRYLDYGVVEVEDFNVYLNYELLIYLDSFYRKFGNDQKMEFGREEIENQLEVGELVDPGELDETLEQKSNRTKTGERNQEGQRELESEDFESGGGPEWF